MLDSLARRTTPLSGMSLEYPKERKESESNERGHSYQRMGQWTLWPSGHVSVKMWQEWLIY